MPAERTEPTPFTIARLCHPGNPCRHVVGIYSAVDEAYDYALYNSDQIVILFARESIDLPDFFVDHLLSTTPSSNDTALNPDSDSECDCGSGSDFEVDFDADDLIESDDERLRSATTYPKSH